MAGRSVADEKCRPAGSTARGNQFGSRPQEAEVSASVPGMLMSLDGYIADPNDFLGGDDGQRLHHWFALGGESAQPSGPSRQFERAPRSGRDRWRRGHRTAHVRPRRGPVGWHTMAGCSQLRGHPSGEAGSSWQQRRDVCLRRAAGRGPARPAGRGTQGHPGAGRQRRRQLDRKLTAKATEVATRRREQ
jgi:hypothetical protein